MINTINLPRNLVEEIVKTCAFTLTEIAYQELRSYLAEPVPPAGETHNDIRVWECATSSGMTWAHCEETGDWIEVEVVTTRFVLESDHRAHVTRLQAELTSANADKAAYAQNAIDLRAEVARLKQENGERYGSMLELANGVAALKSELTKAQELLKAIPRGVPGFGDWTDKVSEYLSNQSAPADKRQGNNLK